MCQIAACNRLHEVEQRFARWLLMTQDRIERTSLPLTHEFLGNMLGSTRSTVTIAAGILQRAGILEYKRGNLIVKDRVGLQEIACECYGILAHQFQVYLRHNHRP